MTNQLLLLQKQIIFETETQKEKLKIIMCDEKLEQPDARWGTWEELLLASAVNRHGPDNWDSVSMEMSSKTSLPRLLTTPNSCQLKYQDLHRRFTDLDVPWLDHLRKLRVAELRRDLRRNDLSILALQTRVKRLEEERERSVSAEAKPERENPDLVTKRQRSSNEETRSGNGSNSTEEEEGAAADRVRVRAKEDDVQSSASLGRKVGDPVVARGVAVKSEPLVGLLEMIRSHPHGALFQRRLQPQESQKYRGTVRQHVDLETIQRRLNDGFYASSAVTLHRDLLLLLTNAVVFFTPNSTHSDAAHQLRDLLLHHIRRQSQPRTHSADPPPQPRPELETSDSPATRKKPSAPIIVCRKRTRPPPSTNSAQEPVETTTPPAVEPVALNKPEKPVTGVRSSRRNSKKAGGNGTSSTVVTGSGSTGPVTEDEKQKSPEKKKRESTIPAVVAGSEKKRSATDFLKRIKKNSPAKKEEQKKSNNNGKESSGGGKGSNNKKQDQTAAMKSGGRPVRKAAGGGDQQGVAGKRGGKDQLGGGAKDGGQPRKRARK